MSVYSDYFNSLDNDAKNRYIVKISCINGIDPYILPEKKDLDFADLPKISYGNIVNYLVFKVHAHTCEEFQSYKSLEVFNQFACGWVKKVWIHQVGNYIVVSSKVLHSQRLSEKPVSPWVISTPEGIIKAAHCTCMAGLGESCSHVAATMFYVEDIIRNREVSSVTDKPAYWSVPGLKNVPYSKLSGIHLKTPQSILAGRYEDDVRTPGERRTSPGRRLKPEEKLKFLKEVSEGAYFPSALNNFEKFENKAKGRYPPDLRNIFKEEYKHEDIEVLQSVGFCIDFSLTPDQAAELEKDTRYQAKSSLWYSYRAGRISASNFNGVCKTKIDDPAKSLIKKICYPGKLKFSSTATPWGKEHEATALKEYFKEMKKNHPNLKIRKSGFHINPTYPYFGASPDGILECPCCGIGYIEIKCPYSLRDKSKEEIDAANSCLDCRHGVPFLKTDHEYFFQVQMQLFVCDFQFCDFVVWTKNSFYAIRIVRDEKFWTEHSAIATEFFHKVIVPELLGKVYTEPGGVTNEEEDDNIQGNEENIQGNDKIQENEEVIEDGGNETLADFDNVSFACVPAVSSVLDTSPHVSEVVRFSPRKGRSWAVTPHASADLEAPVLDKHENSPVLHTPRHFSQVRFSPRRGKGWRITPNASPVPHRKGSTKPPAPLACPSPIGLSEPPPTPTGQRTSPIASTSRHSPSSTPVRRLSTARLLTFTTPKKTRKWTVVLDEK